MNATRVIGTSTLPGWACVALALISTLLTLSTAAGDFSAGLAAYRVGDYETAFREWRSAAEQGDAGAANQLGSMYAKGLGVDPDPVEAIRWYRQAAEQGQRSAQLALVRLLHDRPGASADEIAEALDWLRRLADEGSVPAQYKLGLRYLHGDGIPADAQQAERWLRLAAEQEFPPAQYELGRIYRNGDGVTYDEREARRWLEAAAAGGVDAAAEILATFGRFREFHLRNGRFLDWPAGRPVTVRTPEEIRRGPGAPVPLQEMDEIHCDFFPRKNRGGNPKFRCFMMTGPAQEGGQYFDAFGNVQPRAAEVLLRPDGGDVRPVLAENGKPLTYRSAFRSHLLEPLELKIKYIPRENTNPVRYRDTHTEVAATRLLWALRYAVDRMYRVPRVVCRRCPADPYTDDEHYESFKEGEGDEHYESFDDVAIEMRYGGEKVVRAETLMDGGWSWDDELWRLRYGRGVAGFTDEQKARFDGLLVLMHLVGQVSARPYQNRLVCVRKSMQPLAGWRFCPETVLLNHDLGAVFGKRHANSLEMWSGTPVWKDPARCELDLPFHQRRQEKPRPLRIGRSGQRFILASLDQLTDEHLCAVFESAGFERYDRTLFEPDEQPSAERGREIVAAWIESFRSKVEEIRSVECPVQ